MISRELFTAFTKEAAKELTLWHGSPTADLKELEPRFDPRTKEKAVFLKGDRESAAAYALLPSRHDSNVNYSTHGGKFSGGKVQFSTQPIDAGWLYEFRVPENSADKVKSSYLFRSKLTPHAVHKVTRQDAEQMGWQFEKKAGVRTNEIIEALREVATKRPAREHLRAWSRHAALNAGIMEDAVTHGRVKDAVHAGVFAALPPVHHTTEDMVSMLPHRHRDYYRWGADRGPKPGS